MSDDLGLFRALRLAVPVSLALWGGIVWGCWRLWHG